ncbi:MAG: hypothetical protein GWP14_00065 [Actinobacteria bacterium]|nr:hypothetical protein [Actinomycetota bacterium]
MHKLNQPADISSHPQRGARKGAVIVMVAILLVALLGCAALAVDVGYLYVARAELQRSADAAALAGAQALGRGLESPFGEYISANDIYSQAEKYAGLNAVVGTGVEVNRNSDIKIGYLANPRDLSVPLQTVALDQCNAVQVIARRDSSNTDGEVKLFFAPIWGINSSEVSASAIAVLDDRFYAYRGGNAIPFTLHVDTWDDEIIQGNGADGYGYDKYTGDVTSSPDGVPEVKLFPNKEGSGCCCKRRGKGCGNSNNGAGNFGILHIGSGSLGVPTLRDQIRNGISQDDFTDLTGEPMVKFYDYDSGNAVSYGINGNPGIKAGIESAIQEKVGQVVGFFLHDSVSGTGSNATFNVIAMRFGRVMAVNLNGKNKAIIIQPVPYYSSGVLTSPNAPSTDRLIGTLELVR